MSLIEEEPQQRTSSAEANNGARTNLQAPRREQVSVNARSAKKNRIEVESA